MKQEQNAKKSPRLSPKARWIAIGCALALVLGLGAAALLGAFGGGSRQAEIGQSASGWLPERGERARRSPEADWMEEPKWAEFPEHSDYLVFPEGAEKPVILEGAER